MNNDLNEAIERFRTECAGAGWDSYGAEPVSGKTCDFALKVAVTLPDVGDKWHVAPTVEGAILFESEDGHFVEVQAMDDEPVDDDPGYLNTGGEADEVDAMMEELESEFDDLGERHDHGLGR